MDVGTLIGAIAGVIIMLFAIMSESSLLLFANLHGFLIVIGGTIAAIFIAYPLQHIKNLMKVVKKAFSFKIISSAELIVMFMEMSTTVKKEGYVKLPSIAKKKFDHEFLNKTMMMLADNSAENKIVKVLKQEMDLTKKKSAIGIEVLNKMAMFAPAFGMCGTLIGLVQMFAKLDDPKAIGPSMSVAVLATFYGALSANLIFSPISLKLKKRSEEETLLMDLILEAGLLLKHQESSIIIEDRLLVFLDNENLKKYSSGKGGKKG